MSDASDDRERTGEVNRTGQTSARRIQLDPYTGTDAPWISFASSLDRNRITAAISSGRGHLEKSAPGIALRLASVSIMLGSTVLARTPVPCRSAASESIMATAAAFEAA